MAGVGNIFLGDDGFGPEVVRHLGAPEQPPLPEPVRLVDYGIRGLHLSYDLLEGYSALIIVDTMPGLGRPGEIRVVAVDPDDVTASKDPHGPDPHGMDPGPCCPDCHRSAAHCLRPTSSALSRPTWRRDRPV